MLNFKNLSSKKIYFMSNKLTKFMEIRFQFFISNLKYIFSVRRTILKIIQYRKIIIWPKKYFGRYSFHLNWKLIRQSITNLFLDRIPEKVVKNCHKIPVA